MTEDFFGDSRPVKLSDIEQLLTAVSTESFYIKSEEYRKLICLGKTQFNYLKKLGCFDRGTHKSCLGNRRIRIHRYFNYHSQKIEWFGAEKIVPSKRGRKHGQTQKAKAAENAEIPRGELSNE
ncbi:MAG: hypothetical protein LBH25_10060 [Fibromonadaceae bacterium]|jgi:hypothetical protein|nr:hypothetical protein [Fibromonadaceae bacterium]